MIRALIDYKKRLVTMTFLTIRDNQVTKRNVITKKIESSDLSKVSRQFQVFGDVKPIKLYAFLEFLKEIQPFINYHDVIEMYMIGHSGISILLKGITNEYFDDFTINAFNNYLIEHNYSIKGIITKAVHSANGTNALGLFKEQVRTNLEQLKEHIKEDYSIEFIDGSMAK